jgi:hypothetical protein
MQEYQQMAAKSQADIHRPILSENIMATVDSISTVVLIHGESKVNLWL